MRARTHFSAICLSVCLLTASFAATKQPIKKLKHDPNVPSVDLFEAIEKGTVETTVIAKSANDANLFITNKSQAAVSVKMPPAVVAVQVLKQFSPPGGQSGLGNSGQQGGNTGMGQAQSIGGGSQNSMGNNSSNGSMSGIGNGFSNIGSGIGNNAGTGFFSVPPQKTVQVPLKTVCLSHGKPDPRPRMKYQLVKLEDFSDDPVLHETLKLYASGEIEVQSAQAAVWHLTDNMSWKDLRAKQIERLGGLDPLPYFSQGDVDAAERLIAKAREMAKDKSRKVERAAR
ncbi:MAG TPA: hypothetical protein VKU82_00485 [Planctomycetaceae bacterium]|nr:hypothetical protein [Planctomycetaceae bacterium]